LASSNFAVLMSGAWLSFFDLGAWGTLIALTPSQFPQAIRGTGMGAAQSIGRVGAMIGPYAVGILLQMKTPLTGSFGSFVVLLLLGIAILTWGIQDVDAQRKEGVSGEAKA